ncbi:MAG: methyltransferase domain-containing protein [Rhizobiales bacterium]|nr:methyltransferase domain-containing protein [Hyphomicrobiales bacterium]
MLDTNHPFFPTFERLMGEAATRPPVYDLGTSGRFAKEIGLVRHLFDETTYKAGGFQTDADGGAEACDFQCDLQALTGIADGETGSVVCLSVLEHVADPQRAVNEIARVLRPGGLAIVSVPFFFSYHAKSRRVTNPVYDRRAHWEIDSSHTGYGDFWRMTHEGLALMFARAGFSRVDVYPTEGPLLALLRFSGLYYRICRIRLMVRLLARLDRCRLGGLTTMHFVRAEK